MYTCDYLRYFDLLAYPFLFVMCVCFYCNRWSCYTQEQVILQMVLWKMLLNEPVAALKAFW